MKLYLIRHAQALAADVDPQKGLSEEGKRTARIVAVFLAQNHTSVVEIWHSTKLRAQQTAEIISEHIRAGSVRKIEGLAPNDPPQDMVRKITEAHNDLMVVSHLPFLGKLVSLLLTGSDTFDIVTFEACGCVCLELSDTWKISWAISKGCIQPGLPAVKEEEAIE